MANDWLAARRNEVAAERILDAAGTLFAERDPSSVGMREIARAAGCSRATLYRYFENRDALHTAYVHGQAYALYDRMIECITGIDDPRERLIAGFTTSIAMVRQSPALASWFASTQAPIGGEIAEQSDVIKAMTAAFLISLGPDEPAVVGRRARWLVRVMTSLLIFPGTDEADERALIEEFLVPIVAPAGQAIGSAVS
jgi:AcrR family transcriptional regulator